MGSWGQWEEQTSLLNRVIKIRGFGDPGVASLLVECMKASRLLGQRLARRELLRRTTPRVLVRDGVGDTHLRLDFGGVGTGAKDDADKEHTCSSLSWLVARLPDIVAEWPIWCTAEVPSQRLC